MFAGILLLILDGDSIINSTLLLIILVFLVGQTFIHSLIWEPTLPKAFYLRKNISPSSLGTFLLLGAFGFMIQASWHIYQGWAQLHFKARRKAEFIHLQRLQKSQICGLLQQGAIFTNRGAANLLQIVRQLYRLKSGHI